MKRKSKATPTFLRSHRGSRAGLFSLVCPAIAICSGMILAATFSPSAFAAEKDVVATYSINGTNDLVATFTQVPEPSAFAMLLGGLGILIGFRRFRRTC